MASLKRLYEAFNKQFFDGKLPDIPVYWGLLPKEALAVTQFRRYKPKRIILNARHSWMVSIMTLALLHEMCHVALPYHVNHGKRFQKEMRRLASEGAFDHLW